jgi:hypothetical protein
MNLTQVNASFLQAQKRAAKLLSSLVLTPEQRLELSRRWTTINLSIGLATRMSNMFDDLKNLDPKQIEARAERFAEQLAEFSKFLDQLEQGPGRSGQ